MKENNFDIRVEAEKVYDNLYGSVLLPEGGIDLFSEGFIQGVTYMKDKELGMNFSRDFINFLERSMDEDYLVHEGYVDPYVIKFLERYDIKNLDELYGMIGKNIGSDYRHEKHGSLAETIRSFSRDMGLHHYQELLVNLFDDSPSEGRSEVSPYYYIVHVEAEKVAPDTSYKYKSSRVGKFIKFLEKNNIRDLSEEITCLGFDDISAVFFDRLEAEKFADALLRVLPKASKEYSKKYGFGVVKVTGKWRSSSDGGYELLGNPDGNFKEL